MKEDKIYEYLFHYNPHTQLWYAIHREDINNYWNGEVTKREVLSDVSSFGVIGKLNVMLDNEVEES